MHLQVKASVPKRGHDASMATTAKMVAVSATIRGRGPRRDAQVPQADGFNLRTAGGSHVELGGDFNFWVDGRSDDEMTTPRRARPPRAPRKEGYAAQVYEVHAEHLAETRGTLREFVRRVDRTGSWSRRSSVGTPDAEGIPVQIFAVQRATGRLITDSGAGTNRATSPDRPSVGCGQTGPCRDHGRLDPAADAELVEDVGHVHARGLRADEELLGDLSVGPTGRHQREHLEFAH